MVRWLIAVAILLVVALSGGWLWLNQINDYQTEGTLALPVLSAPVVVTRDARGVAHIAAQNRRDMLRAQGFITAQDRLFQMEFFRMVAWGRLAELIGEQGVKSDTEIRVFGLPHNARRMAAQFSPDVKQFLGDYLDGLNAYIATMEHEFPRELSLIGHTPTPWSLEDSAVILNYVSLLHSVNMQAEAVALALVDAVGPDMARLITPINQNPDRIPQALPTRFDLPQTDVARHVAPVSSPLPAPALYTEIAPLHFGSNNWVVGPQRSATGSAVVVNDPHLDARLLPGVWYPIGLSTPDFHATGVALPAIPGVLVGRTDRVAYGVTNAYGDVQDLFIEKVDPNSPSHYLEGNQAVAFDVREERIRIKDEHAKGGAREKVITVRSTHRGPVISDHDIVDLGDRVVSFKWGASVAFGPEIGYDKLFFARSAQEADEAAQLIDIHMFNIVFADVDGNFGRRATGKIPIRRQGEGVMPLEVTDAGPYWTSWIPKDQLPGEFNPERGWTGTANHDTRPTDYPYTYSTYFSPAYRYQRLSQLMEANEQVTLKDHWAYMHDVTNLQAANTVPLLLPLLRAVGHNEMAQTLASWSFEDSIDARTPLLYQTLYRELAIHTFEDELGPPLAGALLGNWYFWQERFDTLLQAGQSPWFDDASTGNKETLEDVVKAAADATEKKLANLGEQAQWGDVHRLKFVSPVRQSGFGSTWVGGGEYAMSGSGETLRRARYAFGEPFETAFFASYNLVSDMGERENVSSALPGGVAARVFHDHYHSHIPAWYKGEGTETPLTRQAAQAAAVSRLTLSPASN